MSQRIDEVAYNAARKHPRPPMPWWKSVVTFVVTLLVAALLVAAAGSLTAIIVKLFCFGWRAVP